MEQLEIKRELLKTMDEISQQMRDIVYLNYYDKFTSDEKYILRMMVEAYQTTAVFCYAMQQICITQSGLLLRQLLEQSAISYILVAHRELLPKYIDHYELKLEWCNLRKGEQIDKIAEKFGVPHKQIALTYLDYGWIGFDSIKKCNEDGMLKFAGFDDIIIWRKNYLDKLAHSSFTSSDFIGENKDFPILGNFIEIAAKLFDYLCVAFHNLTQFDFVINNVKLFKQFRELYNSYHI